MVAVATVLNFENPGDTSNQEKLDSIVAKERYTGINDRTNTQVEKFIRGIKATANDPTISRGIERRPDTPAEPTNSMRIQTESYPKSAERQGIHYLGSWELPSLIDSIKKRWKKNNELLYKGLPTCPNIDKSALNTSTDTKEDAEEELMDAARLLGAAKYNTALSKAQAFIDEQQKELLGDIPNDAPEWVLVYAGKFGDAPRGYFRWEGLQVWVTRAQDASIEQSGKNARKLIPTGTTEVDDYAFVSTNNTTDPVRVTYVLWTVI